MDDTNQLKKKRGSTVQNFFQQLVRLKPVRGKWEKNRKTEINVSLFFQNFFYFYVIVIACSLAQVSLISKRLVKWSEVIWNCNSESQLGTDNESQYKTWSSLK